MAIPDFQSLMLPVLRRLGERQWGTAELVAAMADEHGLNDQERKALLPSGRQLTIANRTHWALAYLNKAGLITRVARGMYEAAPEGALLLKAPPDRITIPYLRKYPVFAEFRGGAGNGRDAMAVHEPVADLISPAIATPEERLEGADRDLKAELAATLLGRLRALPPEVFEQLIIDLLVRMGYGGSRREASERLGRSGDGGIDGIIRKTRSGSTPFTSRRSDTAKATRLGRPPCRASRALCSETAQPRACS